jgi:NAD(P)-dependent dehydrogenase (short-subunit alcohol dehydrogenase family)
MRYSVKLLCQISRKSQCDALTSRAKEKGYEMTINYFDLNNKIAMVTGASSGLGIHFAKILAAEGATVILAARRHEKLESIVSEIIADGGKASALSLDVTNPESVQQCFKTIEGDFGGLDILINNAGVANDPTKFVDITEDEWSWVVDTNMTGAWRVAQAATRQMIATNKPGSIINISSIYGLHTGVLKAGYNVSKAGVVQLTKSMAMELARYNIRVNALCPGWFLTDINSGYFASESGARYVKSLPSRRLGNMEELTVPLLMLASNKASSYINGSCITVDGGLVESPV